MPRASADDRLTKRKRAQCRRAGLRSGVVRRRRARRRRGIPVGVGRHLPLEFEIRRLSRGEFDARYQALWPRPERPTAAASWERGRETVWSHVLGVYALLSARGQHCRTTNGQRGAALSSRGAPRSRRTLQRYSRKLEAMGVATVMHVRKPQGQLDCLAVEWHVTRRVRMLHVTPPSGTVNPWLRQGGLPPYVNTHDSIPPPSAADEEPPDKRAERPGTTREEVEAQIRFAQLKLDMHFGDPAAVRHRLRELRDQLQAIPEPASPPQPPEGSDG